MTVPTLAHHGTLLRSDGFGTFVAPAQVKEAASWANGPGGIPGSNLTPTLLTLLGGQVDETLTGSSCTIAADTTNYKLGSQGWQMQMTGAQSNAFCIYDIHTAPISAPPISAIGMWVYLPNANLITLLEIQVYTTSYPTNAWIRDFTTQWNGSTGPAFVNGWNFLRVGAAAGSLTGWGTVSGVRVRVSCTATTTITIGHLWGECPPKAQLMLDIPHPYYSDWVAGIDGGGYPDWKARGLPCVLGPDFTLMGTGTYPNDEASWAQIQAILNDGNGNELNFNGYDATSTQTMTSAQIITDCMKAIKGFESLGVNMAPWRSSWVGSLANNAAAAQSLFLMYGTATAASGQTTCWPPEDPWNMFHYSVYGGSTADFDTLFSTLQTTHGFSHCLMHGVNPIGVSGLWTSPALWTYFLAKVDAAIAAGWLEVVTVAQLMARSGVKHRRSLGDWTTQYVDQWGAYQDVRLP